MTTYRGILKDAFLISWRGKRLWIFGFFTTFLTIVGSLGMISSHLSSAPNRTSQFFNWLTNVELVFNLKFWQNALVAFGRNPAALGRITTIGLIALAVVLLVVYLSANSQVALILAGPQILTGARPQLRQVWRAAKKYFWSAFFINLLVSAAEGIIFLIFSAMAAQLFLSDGSVFNTLAYDLLFILYVAVTVCVYFTGLYALNFRVLKNETFGQSLNSAFRLFQQNWLVSLEMAAILIGLVAIISALSPILTTAVYVPFSLVTLMFSFMGIKNVVFFLGLSLGLLIIALLVLLGSWLTTVIISAWTDLFAKLTKDGVVSKKKRLYIRKKVESL
ncbi:hypothetical protein HY224_02110 [Candidatus Uhrbacteria bacterium]|nr:hypothetical protein [Candidatus Uhrbacteria bacterium]